MKAKELIVVACAVLVIGFAGCNKTASDKGSANSGKSSAAEGGSSMFTSEAPVVHPEPVIPAARPQQPQTLTSRSAGGTAQPSAATNRMERILASRGVTPTTTSKIVCAGKEITDRPALDSLWNAIKTAKVVKGKLGSNAREVQLYAGEKRATIIVASNGTACFKLAARPGQTQQTIYKIDGLNSVVGMAAAGAPAAAPMTASHPAPAAPAAPPAMSNTAGTPASPAPVAAIATEAITRQ